MVFFGLVEISLCKTTNWLDLWNKIWSKTTNVVELKYRQHAACECECECECEYYVYLISFPDLLWTKPKARSGKVRKFVFLDWLPHLTPVQSPL